MNRRRFFNDGFKRPAADLVYEQSTRHGNLNPLAPTREQPMFMQCRPETDPMITVPNGQYDRLGQPIACDRGDAEFTQRAQQIAAASNPLYEPVARQPRQQVRRSLRAQSQTSTYLVGGHVGPTFRGESVDEVHSDR